MPRNEKIQTECAPWQPEAAQVLASYMKIRGLKSMRELEYVTGIDRNKLGLIRNCRPGVSVNFWKRALTNFIALAESGKGRDALMILVKESLRMDTFKYSFTSYVRQCVDVRN